jgi:hypothetical protein
MPLLEKCTPHMARCNLHDCGDRFEAIEGFDVDLPVLPSSLMNHQRGWFVSWPDR